MLFVDRDSSPNDDDLLLSRPSRTSGIRTCGAGFPVGLFREKAPKVAFHMWRATATTDTSNSGFCPFRK